jgi:hypothetical protein
MPSPEVVGLLQAAIEASIYIAPTEPGLTIRELYEIGKQSGRQDGEINDAIRELTKQHYGHRDERIQVDEHLIHLCGHLIFAEEPDLRNPEAFDFVVAELMAAEKSDGERNAQIPRNVLVERAVADGIPAHDTQVAITLMVASGQVTDQNGVLRFKSPHVLGGQRPLPSANRRPGGPFRSKAVRSKVYGHVKDVVERRVDGRPQNADPLEAFADQLEKLGYARLRGWWHQTAGELSRTNPYSSPLSATVLAAALVEGALTLIVEHGRKLGIGVFTSNDFDGPPRNWKIEKLVTSAAHNATILDSATKHLADTLIHTRQRIHAGRMLHDYPGPVPDLRPDEARDAKMIADKVVRCVLDWLAKHSTR